MAAGSGRFLVHDESRIFDRHWRRHAQRGLAQEEAGARSERLREVWRVHQKSSRRKASVPSWTEWGGISRVIDLEGVVRNSREGRKSLTDGLAQVQRTLDHGALWVSECSNCPANCPAWHNYFLLKISIGGRLMQSTVYLKLCWNFEIFNFFVLPDPKVPSSTYLRWLLVLASKPWTVSVCQTVSRIGHCLTLSDIPKFRPPKVSSRTVSTPAWLQRSSFFTPW